MKNSLRWGLLSLGLAATTAYAGPITTTLYFTNYASHQIQSTKGTYTGNGTVGNGTFTLTAPNVITTTPGADGIVRNPNNGDLLIGGQSNAVYQVNPNTGTFTTATPGVQAYHLAVDPNKNVVWASGIPGALSAVPINPFGGAGTVKSITNSVTGFGQNITSLAFTPSNGVFFTDAGPSGYGDFGSINLTTGVATVLLSGVAAAHGMVYDPFSGDLILGGSDQITQIDPTTGTIVSSATFLGNAFDQGAVDGLGHIFWASNNGQLFFMDYSTTNLVGSTGNFVSDNFYQGNLDDVAPLIGAGGTSTSTPVPEPGTLALLGLGFASLVASRRRKT